MQLGGCVKVDVPASGTATGTGALPVEALAYWDTRARSYVTEATSFTFYVCHSFDDADCPAANTHTVAVPTEGRWPGLPPRWRLQAAALGA